MQISILAVGTRLQSWVYDGFDTYKKRLPAHLNLELVEVPAGKRTSRGDVSTAVEKEADQLLRRAQGAERIIALDEAGKQWNTLELADEMRDWLDHYSRIVLMVGGPDGLSKRCLKAADRQWSLSRLTLPHGLVRVLLAEQLYRGWTVLQGHPYHRP